MPDLPNNILTSFLRLCFINYWQAADMHLEISVLCIQCAIKAVKTNCYNNYYYFIWSIYNQCNCRAQDLKAVTVMQCNELRTKMKLSLSFVPVLILILNAQVSLVAMKITLCPNTTADGETKPLYVLTLLSLPGGLTVLSGHRIAQEEINNRTDLLPGYHIELIVDTVEGCSSPEAGLGLSNLLKYTLNPPCRPVVAVAGLGCSSHTSVLSPVAGHDGFNLIQLSAANSPIFETQSHRFPHLWRFLGSATIYTNVILAIMDQYNWTRVGIVYNLGSIFHSEIAKHLYKHIENSTNEYKITFFFGMRGTKSFYLKDVITSIKDTETTILISLLNVNQTAVLLNRTILEEKLAYPKYIWIHIEKLQRYFENNGFREVANISHRHIYLHTQTQLEQNNTVLVSGETYAAFRTKHSKDLDQLNNDYGVNKSRSYFASYWYDQMWALALAVNNSLPRLKDSNLSIENYAINQQDITVVLEEQMANLSFQGAGGWVEFNQNHGVSTPVEVYWMDDGKQKCVGIYNPLDPSNFHVHINASSLPNDTIHRPHEFILISLPMAILMYILTGAVTIFTTVQLVCYLYYREHKVIKATSPYLSLLMFGGFYLLYLSAILSITQDSFITSPQTYDVLIRLIFAIAINAISLILITLLVKLLRIDRIFSSKLETDIGKYWSNVQLLIIIILYTVILNMIMIPVLIHESPTYSNYTIYNGFVEQRHIRPHPRGNLIWFGILISYLILLLLIISCLAIRTRQIKYSNFKDTKKINLLIALVIVIIFLSTAAYFILLNIRKEPEGNIVIILTILIIPTLSQLIMFTSKILSVMAKKILCNISPF